MRAKPAGNRPRVEQKRQLVHGNRIITLHSSVLSLRHIVSRGQKDTNRNWFSYLSIYLHESLLALSPPFITVYRRPRAKAYKAHETVTGGKTRPAPTRSFTRFSPRASCLPFRASPISAQFTLASPTMNIERRAQKDRAALEKIETVTTSIERVGGQASCSRRSKRTAKLRNSLTLRYLRGCRSVGCNRGSLPTSSGFMRNQQRPDLPAWPLVSSPWTPRLCFWTLGYAF